METNNFATVNGARLYYEIIGEGEALVLLHSGYTDLRLWDEQFESFAKYFKVVRYDIRGFGKSERPRQSFSNVDDLKELLDYLGIKKVNLVGISMGGSIAIDFTLTYPNLVECLILSGPSLSGYNPTIDEASRLRSLAGMSIVKRDENFNQSFEYMLNDSMWRQANPNASKLLKNMFMDTSLDWLLDDSLEIYNIAAVDRLLEINKRTMLVIGSDDSQPIKEIAKLLETNISMIRTVTINDTGHLPNLDKPHIFNKVVLDFLLNNN